MVDNQETTWSIIKLNLSAIPWRDFILGMVVPLLLLQFVSLPSVPLLSVFPVITLIFTVTIVAGRYLAHMHPVFALIPSLDATVIGLMFVGSMLRPRPFVMALIDKKTIESTEARFGKSKYFYKAWFDINIMWGMFYIIQGVIISYLMILNLELGNIMNALFGWPSVLLLLYVSVDYPRRYWKKHWEKMKEEIDAAKLYEKGRQAGQHTV
jgi:hypothetical protein